MQFHEYDIHSYDGLTRPRRKLYAIDHDVIKCTWRVKNLFRNSGMRSSTSIVVYLYFFFFFYVFEWKLRGPVKKSVAPEFYRTNACTFFHGTRIGHCARTWTSIRHWNYVARRNGFLGDAKTVCRRLLNSPQAKCLARPAAAAAESSFNPGRSDLL